AIVPVGSKVFHNDNGTAPGIAVQRSGKCVVMLPGPPKEMKPMFKKQVRPFLMQFTGSIIYSHNIRLFGIGESKVDELLGDLLDQSNPTVALYAKPYEVMIRVTAKADDRQTCEEMINKQVYKIKKLVGEYIYGINVNSLQEVLVKSLLEKGKTIALAESCTGGLVAERLTSVPGASGCFSYGIVSYGNQIKEKQLGVDKEALIEFGAVSPQVAEQMAINSKIKGDADIGIGITGVAGPSGGTEQKPVGLVYIGVAYGEKTKTVELHLSRGLPDEREMIRSRACSHALNLALQALKEY
ncbi:MAG: nicotinamide-nucleotide amidohydrolase family protein, partial [Sporomusa sp.]